LAVAESSSLSVPGSGRFGGVRVLVVGGGADGPPATPGGIAMGNGRAIAHRFLAEGAAVAVTDRDVRLAEETLASSGVAAGATAGIAIEADAADPEACRAAVRTAEAGLGGLDVVVCNVGIGGGAPIRAQQVDDWDRTMDINVRSHWITAAEALGGMSDRGRGSLVFVSSLSGLASNGLALAYEVSKAAQLAIVRHIAVRYAARGIRANAVLLGYVDSTMARRVQGAGASVRAGRAALAPARRQGTPAEVAGVVAFLASDDAAYVNGAAVPVDGGVLAQSPDVVTRSLVPQEVPRT
jgi:NAD(P)-dependent dehydrogenase (short-subunit alcohol dehydrogenase family)